MERLSRRELLGLLGANTAALVFSSSCSSEKDQKIEDAETISIETNRNTVYTIDNIPQNSTSDIGVERLIIHSNYSLTFTMLELADHVTTIPLGQQKSDPELNSAVFFVPFDKTFDALKAEEKLKENHALSKDFGINLNAAANVARIMESYRLGGDSILTFQSTPKLDEELMLVFGRNMFYVDGKNLNATSILKYKFIFKSPPNIS